MVRTDLDPRKLMGPVPVTLSPLSPILHHTLWTIAQHRRNGDDAGHRPRSHMPCRAASASHVFLQLHHAFWRQKGCEIRQEGMPVDQPICGIDAVGWEPGNQGVQVAREVERSDHLLAAKHLLYPSTQVRIMRTRRKASHHTIKDFIREAVGKTSNGHIHRSPL